MNINCHVPGHESKELSVATSENNTVVGMYLTGVFNQHFGNMTQPLELEFFTSFYTKFGKIIRLNKVKNQILVRD